MNNMVKIALRFRFDLAELIEPNRRRSRVYVEDLVIEGSGKAGLKMRCKMPMLFVYRS